jgi:hypothetical protein
MEGLLDTPSFVADTLAESQRCSAAPRCRPALVNPNAALVREIVPLVGMHT